MALSTTTSYGAQTPANSGLAQPAVGPEGVVSAKAVQPVVSSDALRSQQGVRLDDMPVTTVKLAPGTAATQASPAAPGHHVNPALAGLSVCLFIVAVMLFWLTSRPAKNTT